MATEHEHRDRLKRAQQSAEFIQEFLSIIEKLPQSESSDQLMQLIGTAKMRAKTLESELDQIWDLFKRIAT